MNFVFNQASEVRAGLRARVALVGPSGSGKTYTALQIAHGIQRAEEKRGAEAPKICVLDSENRSAARYSHLCDYAHCVIPDYSPKTYTAAIKAAEKAGFGIIIIDSLSHAWRGALDEVDKHAARSKGNSYAAWRHVTPMHNGLVDAMLQSRAHIVVTMRAKTEYVMEQDSRGKMVPRKIGLAPVQRDGVEYEFDLVADIEIDTHNFITSKSRFPGLDGLVMTAPGPELGERLLAELTTHGGPVTGGAETESTVEDPEPSPQDQRQTQLESAFARWRKEFTSKHRVLLELDDLGGEWIETGSDEVFAQMRDLVEAARAEREQEDDTTEPPAEAAE